MPPSKRPPLNTGSVTRRIEEFIQDRSFFKPSISAASGEAGASGIPGASGGPQDAYRHLLISADLVRRLGDRAGPLLPKMHEYGNNSRREQSSADSAMDKHNNRIAITRPILEMLA